MIFKQLKDQLQFLSNLLLHISNEQYITKIVHLDGATIGEHTRHIIDLFTTMMEGYAKGEIDYAHRKRNLRLETDIQYAIQTIHQITATVELQDKRLVVLSDLENNSHSNQTDSTYFRELVYGTEHAIHHFALIKVALIELKQTLPDPNFGMAYATIKYRESLQSS